MGKYTSLARLREEPGPQKKDMLTPLDNTYKHSILIDTSNNSVDTPSDVATPLRPYAVNAVVRCIHGATEERCAVCSGYVRWLTADEERLSRAQNNPEAVRREFWRLVLGEEAPV
jgi:hypothetical protein